MRCWLCVLSLALLSSSVAPLYAQDEDLDPEPGLAATLRAGDVTVRRIDTALQFDWQDGAADAELPTGPFTAKWSGILSIRSPAKYRFSIFGSGKARVTLDGNEVIAGNLKQPGWQQGPEVSLAADDLPIEVTFESSGEPAMFRLFWESERFAREPVPAQALLHMPQPEIQTLARGRELSTALRCGRCHLRDGEEESPPGPALDKLANALAPDWLEHHLTASVTQSADHGRTMPNFKITPQESRHIAAALGATPARLTAREASSPDGEQLLFAIGCLACHTHSDQGVGTPLHGGDLTQIGRKRPQDWLEKWLRDPAALNADHRMPVFALETKEVEQLGHFLANSRDTDSQDVARDNNSAEGDAQKGKALVSHYRCSACHRLPFDEKSQNTRRFEAGSIPWEKSCLVAAEDAKNPRPHYQLEPEAELALKAYLNSRSAAASSISATIRGVQLLASKGCLNCHDRNGSRGVTQIASKLAARPELTGQSEALIPPDLTAIGDKLRDDSLAKSVSGDMPAVRLPWLKVRMPRFAHTEADHQALVAALISSDRIPAYDAQPGADWQSATLSADDRKAGGQLLGSKGLSCSACHQIGALVPRNVALGTRGSDLYRLGSRMRPEFFVRWTRAPLRIVPNMEMPSYEKAAPGVYMENLLQQFAGMWHVLNDPTKPPAVDGSHVEQIVTVPVDASPVVLRDVFRVGSEPTTAWIPRSLVAGFDNGQNLLFDIDEAALRLWWRGDLARQRTQGKTWLWEPGVTTGVPDAAASPDLILWDTQARKVIPTEAAGQTSAQLKSYDSSRNGGVKLRYSLIAARGSDRTEIPVEESYQPAGDAIRRRVTVRNLPEAWQAYLRLPPVTGLPAPRPLPDSVKLAQLPGNQDESLQVVALERFQDRQSVSGGYEFGSDSRSDRRADNARSEAVVPAIEDVPVLPGYTGTRLPLDRSIMPTGLAWKTDGTLLLTSLKGQVFVARDSEGDGLEDRLSVFEQGLAAPYGLLADGNDVIVAHKPELLRLIDQDGDGRADRREVIASGWGYSDDYHDWTCSPVRDAKGNIYIGLGSDYANPKRDRKTTKWRGKVLRIRPDRSIEVVASGLRYPTGVAVSPEGLLVASDNQGVQNTFNEINVLSDGGRYGVPAVEDDAKLSAQAAALQIPHPWSRSVNGLFFLPTDEKLAGPFAGHGIGCEYDSRFLMRFTLHRVGETWQGTSYPFSHNESPQPPAGLRGTLCGGVSPAGDLYIGCIHDSGWLGGPNVGDIVRFRRTGEFPLGIRQVWQEQETLVVRFTGEVDRDRAARPETFHLTSYTRKWQGAYATPDSERHTVEVSSAMWRDDGALVLKLAQPLRPGFVCELRCDTVHPDGQTALWPAEAAITIGDWRSGD